MTPLVYNLSVLLALALIAVGAAFQWGLPIACVLVGSLVLVSTFVLLILTASGKKD